ncbi:uncharacterized protein LOC131631474 [Vicia villosa]|uniref:uncharacterized protein LOC131631474 n=1 Tax=Vicia villosa TaxID=3911 RepID=UPI00273CC02E|nr:uncharacterized protein LOC131631474 [Vicia villosa]
MEEGNLEENEGEEILEDTNGDITIEEERIGGYECPKFIFSAAEKERMQRPWRRGVIVKLLGRRIGYKTLENRLNQMWVRRGVINIIELSNDYYLVAFSHEDDKKAAMANGPWFIYDHYLTVKDWKPNFQPESDTIDEVAVWVRITGLPIEYYRPKALTSFGNRIGRTIKIDKTTTKQERGKYARICVAVNLSQPLLGMFSIGGSSYNIEYEGMHLLCLVRGRYGHYKEGCMNQSNEKEKMAAGSGTEGRMVNNNVCEVEVGQGHVEEANGPWKVVQNQKRGKRMIDGQRNIPPMRINDKNGKDGSRFLALEINDQELNGDDEIVIGDKGGDTDIMGEDFMAQGDNNGITSNNMVIINETDGGQDKENIGINMATQVGDLKNTNTMSLHDAIGGTEKDGTRENG